MTSADSFLKSLLNKQKMPTEIEQWNKYFSGDT